jgi:hypothetical protein
VILGFLARPSRNLKIRKFRSKDKEEDKKR